MSNLRNKRKKASMIIFAAIGSSGFVAATPLVQMELPKQVFMTVLNVAMYTVIWDTYFSEELSQKDIKSILTELVAITLLCAGTAYVCAKGATALIGEILNSWGTPIGWIFAGVISSLVTGLLGAAWACYCDDLFRNPSR